MWPLPALVAVVAVGLGLSLYAGVLAGAFPPTADRSARATLDAVEAAVTTDGVARPDDLRRGLTTVPVGTDANVSLTVGGRRWAVGPTPPREADRSSRRVPVRTATGRIRAGTLAVEVWP